MTLSATEIEVKTVLHWFVLWNKSKKEAFLEVLLDKAIPNHTPFLAECIDQLSICDTSPSIFTCQLKLFSTYFERWTDKERNNFLRKLQEQDRDFVEAFYQKLELSQ